MTFPQYMTQDCFLSEPAEILREKTEALVRTMTTEEKAELCHGQCNPEVPGQIGNGGYLAGVPRLGVPEIRMYDGPAGVTSLYETTGLPAEEMLASSWSRDLAYEFGRVSGSENRMISGNCQLGAELDLVRTTHFNRTRDMLGEDPCLAGGLSVPLVRGIQDQNVMAILKHFAGYVVSANPADSPDTVIDEQTMHELYLSPFEKAIHEADAAGVMTAYSRINGPYAANSEDLLKGVLRDEWHFEGLTMCDWGGNHSFSLKKGLDMEMPMGAYNSTERILRFLETGKLAAEELDDAVRHILSAMGKAGYLSLVRIRDDGYAEEEPGRTDPIRIPDLYDHSEGLRAANAKTAQKIAEKGAVLLKNEDHTLPLLPSDFGKETDIAVIGTGGKYAICGYGQERSYGTLRYMTSVSEELENQTGRKIRTETGIDLVGHTIPAEMLSADEGGRRPGLMRYYGISAEDGYRPAPMSMGGEGLEFTGVAERDKDEDEEGALDFVPMELFRPSSDAADMEGYETGSEYGIDPVLSFTCEEGNKTWKGGEAFPNGTAYTWKGFLLAPEDGEYQLNLQAIGGIAVFKMLLGGEWKDMGVIRLREGTQWPWGNLMCTPEGMEVCAVRVRLEGGKRYPVIVYGKAMLQHKDLQIRLAWVTPKESGLAFRAAVDAAGHAKKVLLTIHSGFRLQTGCFRSGMSFADGTDLELEEEQKKLLEAVADAVHGNGGRLAVAAYNGSAFAMKSWIDKADALIWMWMPGQVGGKALARLLTGEVSPGGKLPQSFPAVNEDTPVTDSPAHLAERYAGITEPGKPRKVCAAEGLFTGYRWHDRTGKAPLFPFGFGLSYTEFRYAGLKIAEMAEDGSVQVEFDVENTGNAAADEIAQVYLAGGQVPEHAMLPVKKLCAFDRICDIRPGEVRHVLLNIPAESFLYWDVTADGPLKWKKVTGDRKVLVGASSADIRLEGTIPVCVQP